MEFHQKISEFFENSLKSSDIETINIQSFLDKNSRNGLAGLINIGGTDFLLSSIQALSSCETLTKFILTQSHKYLNDKYVAKDNSSLISCYSELIYQMWVGTNKEINPSKFRDLFFNQIFKTSRSSNMDVLDILIILLEKFHHELNENKKKIDEDEINFYEQQIGESDGVAALRWWKLHKLLNESIIIDLFQGQLKVKISCPICKWTNVSYPPFLYLNLPMPNKDEMTKSTFRVFPYSNNLFNYVEVPIYGVNKFTSILNIKNKIAQYKMFSKSNIEAVLFEDNELVEILQDKTLIYDYVFPRYDFGDDYFIDYEIAFMEKPENKSNKNDEISLYVTPIVFEEEKGWFSTIKNIVAITYCKYFSFDINSTVKDLQIEIFKYYRRGFDDKYKTDEEENIDDSYYIEFYQKLNDKKYIEDEYNKFVAENGFFDIYIYHNIVKDDGWIFSGTPCEFCGFTSTKKKCCKLNYTKNIKLKEIIQNLKTQRPLFLLVDFQKYEYMFKSFYRPFIDENDPHMCLTQDITIYDCLEIYSQEKKLTGEKNFICSKCNRSVTPLQSVFPYSSPKYLILGIQRIKKKFEDLTEMINNKKDDRLVGYPLEDFDVTSYFINDTILNKDNPNKKSIYNLKSIILHCGTIKKSNYKTIVKNKNNWYEIEDNDIKQIEINEVINQNAYVLIYEKIDKSNEIDEKENNDKSKEDKKDSKKEENPFNLDSDNFGNKEKKVYLKKEKKNVKKFKEEEDLLNDEELFGIKSYGEMEDI
jgi:ubiquitin C-terminal hydrolase